MAGERWRERRSGAKHLFASLRRLTPGLHPPREENRIDAASEVATVVAEDRSQTPEDVGHVAAATKADVVPLIYMRSSHVVAPSFFR